MPLHTLDFLGFISMAIQVVQVIGPEPVHAPARRWPRHKTDITVQLITLEPTEAAIVQGRGSGLNCGGLAVSGRVDLQVGAQVAVEFTPPHSEQPVRARCFVRNRQRDIYGLEFITENDSDYESVAQIEALLATMGKAGPVQS
jgi:hypothetical protein